MAGENKRPMNPRDRDPARESGRKADSHERNRERSAEDERREPSLPEQTRKLGKRHD